VRATILDHTGGIGNRKLAELEYMANTIPSSWEFCRYTFFIEGVTRSLTHQLVRTRTAAYAQQTMQILDVRGFEYHTGPTIAGAPHLRLEYDDVMQRINQGYEWLIDNDSSVEDARELLPHGILTNICMETSLRTLVDLFHARISPRNLGMFRDLCVMMRDEVLRVHPWAHLFLDRTLDRALAELDEMLRQLPGGVDPESDKFRMLKLVDQIRRKT
jgi:thymidylate synthase ThyX